MTPAETLGLELSQRRPSRPARETHLVDAAWVLVRHGQYGPRRLASLLGLGPAEGYQLWRHVREMALRPERGRR